MRAIEAVIFLALAAGIHAGIWFAAPTETGTASNGNSGTAEVTVLAATPAQAAMISRWQRPPTVADNAPVRARAPTAAPPDEALALPGLTQAPEINRKAERPAVLSALPAPDLPQLDTSPSAPPAVAPPPEPLRPKARPDTPRQPTRAADSPAQPESRAQGKATAAQKGQGGADQAQSDTAQRALALRAQWGSKIHAKVQRNLRYPRGASGSGTAKLALEIAPSGKLLSLSLLRSSGSALLDKAAIRAVHSSGRFARAPAELSDSRYAFSLSLTFNR